MSIIPVGTKRQDVEVWLDEKSRTETWIFVGVASGSENNQEATDVAEKISVHEMLVLRQQGYEMPEGFKPEVIGQQIDGTTFRVTMFRFVESDWKREVMHRDEKKA